MTRRLLLLAAFVALYTGTASPGAQAAGAEEISGGRVLVEYNSLLSLSQHFIRRELIRLPVGAVRIFRYYRPTFSSPAK